ncbi:hypothetical protein BH09PSE2_BH09PSE2_10700 [soil metagenome]
MRKFAVAAAAVAFVMGAGAGSAALAKAPARSAAYKPARLSDGHPDLNGVWQVMNTANWDIEPHAARAALQMRPGPVVPVPAKEVLALGAVGSVPGGPGVVVGGMIPYTPAALKQRDDNRAHYLERDPEVKCYLPGVPRATYMDHPFQILQSTSQMLFTYEYDSAVRNMLFKDPGPAPTDSWMGQSVAHWEGDTLVVVVSGFIDQSWLDRAGNHHTDQLKVVERYTPTSANTVRYEAELTDPGVYTRPWKMEMNLYRRQGADAQLQQFKCVEFVEELMYGALRKNPLK